MPSALDKGASNPTALLYPLPIRTSGDPSPPPRPLPLRRPHMHCLGQPFPQKSASLFLTPPDPLSESHGERIGGRAEGGGNTQGGGACRSISSQAPPLLFFSWLTKNGPICKGFWEGQRRLPTQQAEPWFAIHPSQFSRAQGKHTREHQGAKHFCPFVMEMGLGEGGLLPPN